MKRRIFMLSLVAAEVTRLKLVYAFPLLAFQFLFIASLRRLLPASSPNLFLVIFRREQRVEFRRVAQFDFVKPAARVRLGVHQRGIVGNGFVDRKSTRL